MNDEQALEVAQGYVKCPCPAADMPGEVCECDCHVFAIHVGLAPFKWSSSEKLEEAYGPWADWEELGGMGLPPLPKQVVQSLATSAGLPIESFEGCWGITMEEFQRLRVIKKNGDALISQILDLGVEAGLRERTI